MLNVLESASATRRLAAASAFIDRFPRDAEVLIVSASRGAADDLAREIGRVRGATFGLYRFSLTQLAARLAAPALAADRLSPTTPLGMEAVAARALFEAAGEGTLTYFQPVAATPGFPRALARTLEELSLAGSSAAALRRLPDGGPDVADLLERFDAQLELASAVGRARFFKTAARAAADGALYARCPLVLIDVVVSSAAERAFVSAIVSRASDALATIPAGDATTHDALSSLGRVESLDDHDAVGLDRIGRYLFAPSPPPPAAPLDALELFSAPGEGRECVEIARRVLREARRGVPFDRIAIVVREPRQYAGLLEHALRRAGVPTYFDRGTRRPHPAGRAFMALLACAIDKLSARRFAEYLSLGQVPLDPVNDPGADAATDAFPSSTDEALGAWTGAAPREDDEDAARSVQGHRVFRAPWKWERLLAESKVVAGEERWTRRLNGLIAECELQRRELARTDPDSPRIEQLALKIDDIVHLRAFARPIVSTLAAWPVQATWTEWLGHFERLAPRVLRRADHVLRVLADLRPMGAIGPIALDEAAQVLAGRLTSIEAEPPARRYGRVFVTSPAQLRGRSFTVVFVPALAERMFPHKPREDPLLLDDSRRGLDMALATQHERADGEKLQLRLAVGAADERLYVSFPTVEIGEGRPRVPSLYALEIWRAMTGRVPSAGELQHSAARTSEATLAWPAPADRDEAIDALEHDLATLRALVGAPEDHARGRAQYILQLNESLRRSVRERFMRATRAWSHWDGLTGVTDRIAPVLSRYRLGARAYSLSALQRYASCPYQFLLGAIYRLRPAEDLEPLQRMDPLTRGSLFHAVQAAFYRRLKAQGDLPVTIANRGAALAAIDAAVKHIAADAYELLAPAVDRVWEDEIAAIRRDLRLWVDEIARADGEWIPRSFEWSFGLRDAGRDPESLPEPVVVDGRFPLHGSIDLIEERRGTGELRVTDHKTGKYRGKAHMIVDGGKVLQPVLYALALETALGRPVVEGRLYFATTDGGFRDVRIPLTPQARRAGLEVLEVIDRAIETAFLAPVPAENACTWCDFRAVCGPAVERRIARFKSRDPLADLLELRRKP